MAIFPVELLQIFDWLVFNPFAYALMFIQPQESVTLELVSGRCSGGSRSMEDPDCWEMHGSEANVTPSLQYNTYDNTQHVKMKMSQMIKKTYMY